MKIRKAFQGTIPENKILDTYSESNTDTYSCNYINQPKMKVLWTNPSPDLKFNEQTITLSSSDYDYLIFVYKLYYTYTKNMGQHSSVFVPKGYGCAFCDAMNYGIDGDYNNTANYRRKIERISDTQFSVKTCGVAISKSPYWADNNNYLIPLFVYGGKF